MTLKPVQFSVAMDAKRYSAISNTLEVGILASVPKISFRGETPHALMSVILHLDSWEQFCTVENELHNRNANFRIAVEFEYGGTPLYYRRGDRGMAKVVEESFKPWNSNVRSLSVEVFVGA